MVVLFFSCFSNTAKSKTFPIVSNVFPLIGSKRKRYGFKILVKISARIDQRSLRLCYCVESLV